MRRLERLGRRLRRTPLLIDAMLVVGLSTLAVVEMFQFRALAYRAPDDLSNALTALAVLPMLLRHRQPALSSVPCSSAGLPLPSAATPSATSCSSAS